MADSHKTESSCTQEEQLQRISLYCFGGLTQVTQQLLLQVDGIRGNKNCRYRLRQQLTLISNLLNTNSPHSNTLSHSTTTVGLEPVLVSVEATLQECLQTVGMLAARSNVSQVVFPRKNRLRNVEFNLIQVTSTLTAALTLFLTAQNTTSETATCSTNNMKIIKNPEANFHAGFPKVLKAPSEISNLAVSYNGKGDVTISWTHDITDIIDSFQIMRDDDPSDIFPDVSGYCKNVCLLYDPIRNFKPFRKYTVKVCAINTAGQSLWSEGAIVLIKEAPPNKPLVAPRLITLFNSTTNSTFNEVNSVQLIVPFPCTEECNGLPLEKITVQYSTHRSTEHSYHHEYKFCPENDQVTMTINDIDIEKNDYTFAVFWSNSAGSSPPSDYIEVNQRNIVPSCPPLVWESSNKTGSKIKIRWALPCMNAFAIDKYEIQKLNSRRFIFETCAESSKCSATVKGLRQRTKYVFRVCAVTAFGCRSEYSTPVTIKTKLSKAIKQTIGGAAAIGGFGIGALIGPVTGPIIGVGAAVGIGIRVAETVKSKPGKVATATSIAIASTLPMAVFGTVVAPLVVPVCVGSVARDMIMNRFDQGYTSDQSCSYSDDEQEYDNKE